MENLAYAYIHLDESAMRGISFICLLAGCAINYLTNKSPAPVPRSFYFFATGAVFLAASVEGLIWLAAPSAIASDKLFLVVLTEIGALAALGYLFGFAATGRSIDAYGTPGKWWLAFVPLANLILLVKPSQNQAVALVIGALAMLAGGRVLSIGIQQTVERNTQSAATENPIVADKLAQASLEHSRLEDLLKGVAQEVAVPARLDEITTLTKVSTKGKQIIFYYSLTGSVSSIPDAFATKLQRNFCSGPMKSFIEKGATVTADYHLSDGSSVRTISVDAAQCGGL